MTVLVLLSVLTSCKDNHEDKKPASLAVPNGLVGSVLTAAELRLDKSGFDYKQYSSMDLSPRTRDQYMDENWTVMATTPAAEAQLAEGGTITLWVLKNEEAAWLKAHPRMPRVKRGRETSAVTEASYGDKPRLLSAMSELIEFRYARKKAPEYASEPISSNFDQPVGLAKELPAELLARRGLKESNGYDRVWGTYPKPGATVRPGQLLVVLEYEKPEPPLPDYSGSDGGGSGNLPNPDLPNVNIPGRLCPTRFC